MTHAENDGTFGSISSESIAGSWCDPNANYQHLSMFISKIGYASKGYHHVLKVLFFCVVAAPAASPNSCDVVANVSSAQVGHGVQLPVHRLFDGLRHCVAQVHAHGLRTIAAWELV